MASFLCGRISSTSTPSSNFSRRKILIPCSFVWCNSEGVLGFCLTIAFGHFCQLSTAECQTSLRNQEWTLWVRITAMVPKWHSNVKMLVTLQSLQMQLAWPMEAGQWETYQRVVVSWTILGLTKIVQYARYDPPFVHSLNWIGQFCLKTLGSGAW